MLKIIAANDVGRAINPQTLNGQVQGGIVMGMGNCLTEEYIIEDGVPWSTLFARYKMPSIKHTPEIISHLVEEQTSQGPFGAKGVGEITSINTTPAIANAIYQRDGRPRLPYPGRSGCAAARDQVRHAGSAYHLARCEVSRGAAGCARL